MAESIKLPTAAVNLTNGITDADAWNNPADAKTNNNLYSFAVFDGTAGVSQYLYVSDYQFNLPSDATISGIKAAIAKRASGTASDHFVGLAYLDGTNVSITFPGKQEGTNWSSSESTSYYGNSADPWNRTWTPAEVNDLNFGLVISAEGVAGSGDSALIDSIELTVYYARVYSEVGSGGLSGGGDSDTLLSYNLTGSGGVEVSRQDFNDVDGTGGAVLSGTSVVTSVLNTTVTSNQYSFVCTGDQVVPPNSATQVVHASLSFNAATRVVKWYINNTIAGVDAVRFRSPAAEGATAATIIQIDALQDVGVNPIIGQATVTVQQMTDLQNGLWYLYLRDNETGNIIRGQVVNRANLGAAGAASFINDIDATGGLVAGGRGFFIWTDDATGGIECGGDGTSVRRVIVTTSGGVEIDGTSETGRAYSLNGGGGVVTGGSRITQFTYSPVTGNQGAVAGGQRIVAITPYITPAGIEGGGEASIINTLNLIGSGGVDAAPTSKLNIYWLHNPVEDGGLVAGGQARKEKIHQLQKAIISGIGNSLFSENVLKVVPEVTKLLTPHTVEEQPDLEEQGYRFEIQPTWCFIDENVAVDCCEVVNEDNELAICDAAIPRVLDGRQRHYLPLKNREKAARDRRIATIS